MKVTYCRHGENRRWRQSSFHSANQSETLSLVTLGVCKQRVQLTAPRLPAPGAGPQLTRQGACGVYSASTESNQKEKGKIYFSHTQYRRNKRLFPYGFLGPLRNFNNAACLLLTLCGGRRKGGIWLPGLQSGRGPDRVSNPRTCLGFSSSFR